jgi:hypothetical protein
MADHTRLMHIRPVLNHGAAFSLNHWTAIREGWEAAPTGPSVQPASFEDASDQP